MADQVTFDLNEIKEFVGRLQRAAGGDFRKEIASFLEALGDEFLRLVEDEIIRRNVMDTRLLLTSFHKGAGENVWVLNEGGLALEVGTNVDYASYVNDGHWTCPKGVSMRFVPGSFDGGGFTYDPSAKTGMVLRQRWVEGAHFWESAVRIMEKMMPDLMEAKVQQWLNSYFGG